MLQYKQIDRMVAKVQRLGQVYEPFLITQTLRPQVYICRDGRDIPVKKGYRWGKDFQYADFFFVAQDLDPDKAYYLYSETGGTEQIVFLNGRKIGLTDFVPHALEAIFRTHKYVWLEGLKNGDRVAVESYYSHTYPGTMPYDRTVSYALDDLYDRSFQTLELVALHPGLKAFTEKLQMLNSWYESRKDGFARANVEAVYEKLFALLPMEQICPTDAQLSQACALVDDFFATGKDRKPYVGIVGHSHLDTAWLWTVEETRHKLLRTVSNAVTLLKRHPEYKFFMSTVLYLKWIEEMDPQLFEQVKELIAQGRFEPNGATWVECDGNLTGGEALCRHFLRGKRYLRQKFGYESDTFWLPDTFGYSAAMPQIMKQCGVNYFLTTKLSWNDTNQFPYETFLWKGIDGSQVPVHFNTTHCWADDKTVRSRMDKVLNPRESDAMLIAYGFGDGGGGPSEEMVANAIETQKHFTDAQVEHTTVSDFMKRAVSRPLPTYFGELYLELHRGTYTMIHKLKQLNRRLEEALHDAELVSVLAHDRQAKDMTDRLYDVLLLNQFHDILPGTCIAQATDIAIGEMTQALAEAKAYLAGSGPKQYFNTLPFARTELLPGRNGQIYRDLDGKQQSLAPYTFAPMGYGKRAKSRGQFSFDGVNIVTPQLTAKLEEGKLTSLRYRGREYVQGAFGVVTVAENVPYIYDNWDIDADYKLKEQKAQFVSQELISLGEHMLVVRVTHKLTEDSFLRTDLQFVAHSPLVRFDNALTVADKHILVRSYFESNLQAAHYHCETQFGHVERNCYPRDLSDMAKFEVCAHKWTDLSQHSCGLSLLSDTKYGVSCQGGTLGMTLHKGGTHPDPRGDVGTHRFAYGLLPHDGSLGMETIRQGYGFNLRPIVTGRKDLTCPFTLQDGGSVVAETVKFGEEDGIVLRLYESLGDSACVTLQAPGKKITLCNILEDVQTEACETGTAELTFHPFEIKTVKITD